MSNDKKTRASARPKLPTKKAASGTEAATSQAGAVIDTMKQIQLSAEGANILLDGLENPPKPNQALLAAARRIRENGGFYLAEKDTNLLT